MNQLCRVCGEPAAGFHFGAFTCEGCKSFFGRTCNNMSSLGDCKNGGSCVITRKNRTACKACRLRKCLGVGMSKSGSRYGRRSNWFKIHCLLQDSNNQTNEESIEKAKKLLEEIKVANLKSSQDTDTCKLEIKNEGDDISHDGNESPTPTISSSDVLDTISSSAADSLMSTPPPFGWFTHESSPVPTEALSLFAALSPFLFTAGLGIQSSSSLSQLPNFSQYYPYLLSQISNASSASSSTSSDSPSSATSSPFMMRPSSNRDDDVLLNAGLSEDDKRRGSKDEKIILEPLNLRATAPALPTPIQNDKSHTFKNDSTCSPDQSGKETSHEYVINEDTTKRKEVQLFQKQEIFKVKDKGIKRGSSPVAESCETSSKRGRSQDSNPSFYCDSDESKDNIDTTTIRQTHEQHRNNKSSQERKFTHENIFLHGHKHFQLQDHEQNEPIDLSIKTCSMPSNNICFRSSKDSDTECSNVLACSMTLTPIASSVRDTLSSDLRVEQSANAIDLSCRV